MKRILFIIGMAGMTSIACAQVDGSGRFGYLFGGGGLLGLANTWTGAQTFSGNVSVGGTLGVTGTQTNASSMTLNNDFVIQTDTFNVSQGFVWIGSTVPYRTNLANGQMMIINPAGNTGLYLRCLAGGSAMVMLGGSSQNTNIAALRYDSGNVRTSIDCNGASRLIVAGTGTGGLAIGAGDVAPAAKLEVVAHVASQYIARFATSTTGGVALLIDSGTAYGTPAVNVAGLFVQTPSTQTVDQSSTVMTSGVTVGASGGQVSSFIVLVSTAAVNLQGLTVGIDGQTVELIGTSDTLTCALVDSATLQLAGGASFTMGKGDIIKLRSWAGVWYEEHRANN